MNCVQCGNELPPGAKFCGNCGTVQPSGAGPVPPTPPPPPGAPGAAPVPPTPPPPPGAPGMPPTVGMPPVPPPPPPTEPVGPGGASNWQGVQPVIDMPPTEAVPPVPPPPPPGGPIGPGGPGGPAGGGRSKGPLIALAVVVLAILGVGAFLIFGGSDDDNVRANGNDRTTTTQAEDTTTTAGEDTTTTTAEVETTTTIVLDTTTATTAPNGGGFVQAQDDSGELSLQVPDTWIVDGRPLQNGSPNVIASLDQANFFQASGVSYTRLVTPTDPDTVIDFSIANKNLGGGCATVGERTDYSDPLFTGRKQIFEGCGDANATIFEIAATSDADGRTVEVTTVLVAPDGQDIQDEIERTFTLRPQ